MMLGEVLREPQTSVRRCVVCTTLCPICTFVTVTHIENLHGLHHGLAFLKILDATEHVVKIVLAGVESGEAWYRSTHGVHVVRRQSVVLLE